MTSHYQVVRLGSWANLNSNICRHPNYIHEGVCPPSPNQSWSIIRQPSTVSRRPTLGLLLSDLGLLPRVSSTTSL